MSRPFVVDITPIKRNTGSQHRFQLSTEPPGEALLKTAEVQATQVHLDLTLEFARDDFVVSGSIDVDWTGPCRRCLEDQDGSTPSTIREIFERAPVDGETYRLDENEVDLEPMVREAVLLNLPVAPLCSDDCAGPAPGRFPTSVVQDPDPDEEPPVDPRWAALSDISFEADPE